MILSYAVFFPNTFTDIRVIKHTDYLKNMNKIKSLSSVQYLNKCM